MAALITDTLDKMIPAIDGYVVEVVSDTPISIREGDSYGCYPHTVPDNYVLVTMNDSEGNEFYLIAPDTLVVSTSD